MAVEEGPDAAAAEVLRSEEIAYRVAEDYRIESPMKRTLTGVLLIATSAAALAFAASAQAGAPFSCDPAFEARAQSGNLDPETKTWIIDTARRFYQDRSRDFPANMRAACARPRLRQRGGHRDQGRQAVHPRPGADARARRAAIAARDHRARDRLRRPLRHAAGGAVGSVLRAKFPRHPHRFAIEQGSFF